MASATRVVAVTGQALFDFTTSKGGTVSAICNDFNIDWRLTVTPTVGNMLILHAGPLVVTTSFAVGTGARVQAIPIAIGSGFPPPPLSLLQLQTDTVLQVPTGET